MESTFVLVHSPLVGATTWTLVARELQKLGHQVIVPTLQDNASPPYWQQHAESVCASVGDIESPVILVGHSGAGPILPAIGQALSQPKTAYLFVDAGIPRDGWSRLDLLAEEMPEAIADFRQHLEMGGSIPAWSDADLRDDIPDATLRQAVLEELHPRDLAYFQEPLLVFEDWNQVPCAYLQFSPSYDFCANQARQWRWQYRHLEVGHFHMLVDPYAVTQVILELLAS
jgi:hypothetical protein